MNDHDLDAINARIARDRQRWWTRWLVVQYRDLVTAVILGFGIGVAILTFVYFLVTGR